MTQTHLRPILSRDPAVPGSAVRLHGGPLWFDHVERLSREADPQRVPVAEIDAADLAPFITAPEIAGLDLSRPNLMGVLNVTPDSFSDGGQFLGADGARRHVHAMVQAGADIIDIGGESTRPGAAYVPQKEEIARIVPVIDALSGDICVPISVDTRKAGVARAALNAGARLLNDVSALSHDPNMAQVAAEYGAPICLMHAQGDPTVMQDDPRYAHVLLDVYDHLAERIAVAVAAGIPRGRIIVDPGIGFGKTLAHNLALIERVALFHGLGCAVLLGVSRKRFIGTLGQESEAANRDPGSVAVALHALSQGVQIIRVHDIKAHKQAFALWQALG